MKETVLFPRPHDWKIARLIQRDEALVVQSRFNDKTRTFENEIVIDVKTNTCPQLQAFIVYCEIYCETICKKLRKRQDYMQWVEENRIQED